MSNRDAALIACRILAIYLVARGLMQLSVLPFLLQSGVDRSIGFQVSMVILSPLVLLVLAGFLLWLYSESLARRMVPQEQVLDGQNIKLSARGLQAIAFSVAGAVIMANAAAGLFQAMPGLAVVFAQGYDPLRYHLHTVFLVVEKLILLIFGLILFLGGKVIAGLLKHLYTRAREY